MNILVGAHSLNFIPPQHRHRVGNLFSPGGYWNHSLAFCLDNGVYAAYKNNEEWSDIKFLKHLDKVKATGKNPSWIVCPDVVGDASATKKMGYMGRST
jgi:hypothetical protein